MDAAVDERDEYFAILQAMVLKPLRSVEEFSQEYRRRFHTQQVYTRSTSSQRRSVSPAHTTDNITDDVSEIRRRRAARSFSPSAANLTFHPTITRVSQQLQLATKDCYQRLYVEDLQNRVHKAMVRQQEREHEKQLEEEEELRHLAVAHKPPTVEPDRLFARLYSTGRSHEKWIQAEKKRQEELLEMERLAKKSPSRHDASATKRSDRNVFEDLYRQRRDASRHDDLETRHVDTPKQGLRKSSPATTHLDQVHQRLYSEAAERQHVLEIVQEVRRNSVMEGMFHPNLELARKESTIKPESALAHAGGAASTAPAAHDSTTTSLTTGVIPPDAAKVAPGPIRSRSSSPVVIQGIEALDEVPLESAITPRPAGCLPAEKHHPGAAVQPPPVPRQRSPPRVEAKVTAAVPEKGAPGPAAAAATSATAAPPPLPPPPKSPPAVMSLPTGAIATPILPPQLPKGSQSEEVRERDDGAVVLPAEEKDGLRKAPSSRPLPVEFKKEAPSSRPVAPDPPNQNPPPLGATPGRAPPSTIPSRHGSASVPHSGGRDPPAVPPKHHTQPATPPSSASAREAGASQPRVPVATPDAARHEAVQPASVDVPRSPAGAVSSAQQPPPELRGRKFRTAEEQAAYEQHKKEKREKRAERKRQEEILASTWAAEQHQGDTPAHPPKHHHDRAAAPSGSPGRRGATPPPKEKRDVPKPEALFESAPSASPSGRPDTTEATHTRGPSVELDKVPRNDEPSKEMLLQRRQSRKAIIESMAVLDSPSNS